MDPDERERMLGLIVSDTSGGHPFDVWKKWINESDVAAVALAPGVKDLLSGAEGGDEGQPGDQGADDLFGPAPAPANGSRCQ